MYKVKITEHFKKQLKRLVKKNRPLKDELTDILENFQQGTAIPLGKSLYKIRLKGQASGKSGGYRLYVFIMEIEGILSPICIYSKNEKENITYEEMIYHVESVKEELRQIL